VDRQTVIELLRERLASEPGVLAAWLFGSVARGAHTPSSDVDVAILTTRAPTGTLDDLWLDLGADLTSVLGREVDLVVLDNAPDDLTHRVLRDGVLLLDREPGARIRFEVASRNRFFDMQPVWHEYRRARPAA
jgi:predicted nucleotidyltransferase